MPAHPSGYMQLSKSLKQVVIIQLVIPVVLLAMGIYKGLLQLIYEAGITPDNAGVFTDQLYVFTGQSMLYAMVFTSFFTTAFGHVIVTFYLQLEPGKKSAWAGFVLMFTGALLFFFTGMDSANVTLLQLHPLFYSGIIVFIIGSWIPLRSWSGIYRQWKKNNPASVPPLAVSGIGVYGIIWIACSVIIAGEVIIALLPGSMGLLPSMNTAVFKTITGYFYHALLFCRIVPLYIMLFTVLPGVAGGRLYSNTGARVVLFCLVILSVPFLNNPSNPGTVNYGMLITGIITAFILTISLEYAGRKNGAKKTWFSWVERLPYFDERKYLFAYLFCALVLLMLGSVSSLNNTPLSDNTTWITGSFHLTITGPVFLSIAGMSLYLYTHLSGKKIIWPKLNVTIPYLWVMGMLLFSFGLYWGGLLGQPRFNHTGESSYNTGSVLFSSEWDQANTLTLLGGLILLVAGTLFVLIFWGTMLGKKTEASILNIPVSTSYHPEKSFFLINRFNPWLIIIGVLVAATILPPLLNEAGYSESNTPVLSLNDKPAVQATSLPARQLPLAITKDYGLLLGFLAAVGVFVLILLFCVQASGLQRKLRSQKTSFPG